MRPAGHVLYDELCGQLGPRAIPPDQWQWQKWGKFSEALIVGPNAGPILGYSFGKGRYGVGFWEL